MVWEVHEQEVTWMCGRMESTEEPRHSSMLMLMNTLFSVQPLEWV